VRNSINFDTDIPVMGFIPCDSHQAARKLDEKAEEVRSLLKAGEISDREARIRLAEETMRYDVPAIAVRARQFRPNAKHHRAHYDGSSSGHGSVGGFDMGPIKDWELEEVRDRVIEKLVSAILTPLAEGGYDFFRMSVQPDGSVQQAKFSSYAFHKASWAALQLIRDERRAFSRHQDATDPSDLPLVSAVSSFSVDAPDVHTELMDKTDTIRIDNILATLGAAAFGRMRGARRVHFAAAAARAAFGLPETRRLSSPEARARVRTMIAQDTTLSRQCARNVLTGKVTHPVIEAVWDGWDDDALTTVIGMGDALCNGLVAAAVEDLPRPPARRMAALIRAVVKTGDPHDKQWASLCLDLVDSLVAIECETVSPYSVHRKQQDRNEQLRREAEEARRAWGSRLERAAAWEGAPLGSDPTTVAEYLRTILLDYVPVVSEEDLLDGNLIHE
jgi:hypothetical protein